MSLLGTEDIGRVGCVGRRCYEAASEPSATNHACLARGLWRTTRHTDKRTALRRSKPPADQSGLSVSPVKLKFHGTDTDTDTDTDFLADFRARIVARKSVRQAGCRGARGPFSSPTKSALFLARISVGDARVYTCTCTVHDKLSCTHLQNYTIGASLKSVSVSFPWNLSFTPDILEAYSQECRACRTCRRGCHEYATRMI